jgi:predicted phage terminase large subunit-like protein
MVSRPILLPFARPYQQLILRSPARFKLLICGRRWGKTKLGLLAAVTGHGPRDTYASTAPRWKGALQGARIAWIVPSEDHPAAGEIWNDLTAALKPAAARVFESRHLIKLPRGGSIQLLSGFLPDTLRGPFFDGVVIDECSLQHERAWQALRPTLSDYQGWALLLGTVPEDVARHWFVALHRYAQSDAGQARGWATWRRPSSDNKQLTQADLDEARETLGTNTYLREYGAELLGHEGGVWKQDWFRYYDAPPPPDSIQRLELFLDAAWRTGVRNDFSACQLWARARSDAVPTGAAYYLLDELHGKWESPELRRRVSAFRQIHLSAFPGHSLPLVVETAGGGMVAAQELRAALDFPVIDYEVKGASKLARAELVTPLAEAGRVFLPPPGRAPWVKEVIQELIGFPSLPHDDRHDAATMALQRLSRHTPPAHAYTPSERIDLDHVPF